MLNKEVSVPQVPHDFEAGLRFLSPEEGGRQGPTFQGYRPDLRYEGDADALWMVWPIFLAEEGTLIPGDIPITGKVRARMYIAADELRTTVHRQRLREGVKFFLHEGPHVVAEGVVTHIHALHQDRPRL